ncbi:MAG: hypothetical protein EP318_14985 [Rhodobacteraceae bacterium]|nr:MAG: hypothetical protein EP318_14985 [Paracoccaceae bacterium]
MVYQDATTATSFCWFWALCNIYGRIAPKSTGNAMNKVPSRGGSYIRDKQGDLHVVDGPQKTPAVEGAVAKSSDAEDVLSALQKRLKVNTDQALAAVLGIGRSTVTSWRRRGKVPARYARLVEKDTQERLKAAFEFDLLSDEERAALTLAVVRMHHNWLPKLDEYPEFLRQGGFIPAQISQHVDQALRDILGELERVEYQDVQHCLNAIVFAEFYSE